MIVLENFMFEYSTPPHFLIGNFYLCSLPQQITDHVTQTE